MTLSELIYHLTEISKATDEDLRIAYQSNWPLGSSLENVTSDDQFGCQYPLG